MGKIYIIGEDKHYLNIKTEGILVYPSINEDLNDFVIRSFQNLATSDVVIYDLDNGNWERECEIALHLRMTPEIPSGRQVPFVFTSNHSMCEFLNGVHSQIFLTIGCHFISPDNIKYELPYQQAISIADYCKGFLQRICIRPEGEMGSHSIANVWGASVLNRMISRDDIPMNEALINAQKKLYYKFILAKTTYVSENSHKPSTTVQYQIGKINAVGKRVLLIDDEADKGWLTALTNLLIGASIHSIQEQVPDFDSFTEKSRKEIESDKYDLIFLDLRLNGKKEDDNLAPDEFSGMKVLKKIKNINKGTQVIILTASNKAWNIQALLQLADGFYIKESPEYQFSKEFSEANFTAFKKTIERCLSNTYLRGIYKDMQFIKNEFNSLTTRQNLKQGILQQLDGAFSLISSARESKEYAFAYVALYQILEMITKEYLTINDSIYYFAENNKECSNFRIVSGKCQPCSWGENEFDYPQWKQISSFYYQLKGQTDPYFGASIQKLIEKRNAFMHNDQTLLDKMEFNKKNMKPEYVHHDIFTSCGYKALFEKIKILCNLI